jgi:hypothetical protein
VGKQGADSRGIIDPELPQSLAVLAVKGDWGVLVQQGTSGTLAAQGRNLSRDQHQPEPPDNPTPPASMIRRG